MTKIQEENIKLKVMLVKALWLYSDQDLAKCRDALAEADYDFDAALIHLMRKNYFNTVIFPCRVGDSVYWINEEEDTDREIILEGKVESMCVDDRYNRVWLNCRYDGGLTYSHCMDNNEDALFFKKEEAKKYLEFINEEEKGI